jgi:hypothetical protein
MSLTIKKFIENINKILIFSISLFFVHKRMSHKIQSKNFHSTKCLIDNFLFLIYASQKFF